MKKNHKKSWFFSFIIIAFVFTLMGMHVVQTEAAVKGITLSKTTALLKAGDTLQLKALNTTSSVKWSSDNTKAATVTNGLVRGISEGTAVITASCGKQSAVCKITVYRPVKKVVLKITAPYIEVGDTFTVEANFTPENATYQNLTWRVDDIWWPAIKQISKNKFKAVEEGTATITAYQKDTKKTYKVTIEVKEPLGPFHIEKDGEAVTSIDIFAGGHTIVEGKMDDENAFYEYGINPEFSYSIKDKNIAKVDDRGQVIGISAGSTKLIVTAVNGKSKSCTLTVTDDKDTLALDTVYADNMYDIIGSGNYSQWMNWSGADNTYLFLLSDGQLGVFNRKSDEKSQSLTLYIYSKNFQYVSKKNISLPYTEWGGLYQGEDGFYYTAVGQKNTEQDNLKTVFCIIKMNSDFEEVGRCDITGAECSTRIPYDVGNARMTMDGSTLIVHTDRERYTSSDGNNHQSNITFIIDTVTMKQQYVGALFPYNHVSHSMNQFVKLDGCNLIYVDHGDAYPRSVVLQTHYNFTPGGWSDDYSNRPATADISLLNIAGNIGDNYTGTKVNGFELGTNHNIVAGVSIPHDKLTTANLETYDFQNVYVALASKDGTESKLIWLTDYQSGENISADNLRMVKINDDKFALIYRIVQKKGEINSYRTGIIIIDSNGNILQKKEYDAYFSANTQPICYDNMIVWIDSNYIADDRYLYLDEEEIKEKELCQFSIIYLK